MPIKIHPSISSPKKSSVEAGVLDEFADPTLEMAESADPQVVPDQMLGADTLVQSPVSPDDFSFPPSNSFEDSPNSFIEPEIELSLEDEEDDQVYEDDETENLDEDEDDDELSSDDPNFIIFNLLTSFFKINPTPSDEQMHALADALGMDHETLESHIFAIMSTLMEDEDISEDAKELLQENINQFQD